MKLKNKDIWKIAVRTAMVLSWMRLFDEFMELVFEMVKAAIGKGGEGDAEG